ncbi:MAG: DUF2085 domain-containing protein [Chloroflexota bacterium]
MTTPPKKKVTGRTRDFVVGADKLIYKFSKHWLGVLNTIIAIYVALPILAPVLMNVGATGPARVIYTMYSPMCHQMASRSFFLFGEQAAYPRSLAGTELNPLESYVSTLPEFNGISDENWAEFFIAAREFLGNEQMGYKMALCERDIAIYGFVLIGGLLYGMVRKYRRIRPLPLILFLIIGMGPIGLDGFSQLFGYYATPLNGGDPAGIQALLGTIFPLRESTPFLRTFTGALFGFTLVWLAYPYLDQNMGRTEADLERKLTRIGELP